LLHFFIKWLPPKTVDPPISDFFDGCHLGAPINQFSCSNPEPWRSAPESAERQNSRYDRTALWQNGRTAERQNGRTAEWQNGRMAEWQNGRMAEWRKGQNGYLPTSLMVHANTDTDTDTDTTDIDTDTDTDTF
jgi:hypothetical protein